MIARLSLIASAALVAAPAMAAEEGASFFALSNHTFIELLGFLLFFGILFYFKVPQLIGGKLDERAGRIRGELEEARALREEAQGLLASYERKQNEVKQQAGRIVETARKEALAAAEQARLDLDASIARRLAAADDQIASAEAAAVKTVRDRAVTIAIAAAGEVIAKGLSKADANALIDSSIETVGERLH